MIFHFFLLCISKFVDMSTVDLHTLGMVGVLHEFLEYQPWASHLCTVLNFLLTSFSMAFIR